MMTTPFNFMQFNSMIPLMVFYPLNDKVSCAADCPFHRVVQRRPQNVPQRKSCSTMSTECRQRRRVAVAVSFYKHLNWPSIYPLIDCVQEATQQQQQQRMKSCLVALLNSWYLIDKETIDGTVLPPFHRSIHPVDRNSVARNACTSRSIW